MGNRGHQLHNRVTEGQAAGLLSVGEGFFSKPAPVCLQHMTGLVSFKGKKKKRNTACGCKICVKEGKFFSGGLKTRAEGRREIKIGSCGGKKKEVYFITHICNIG